MSFGFDLGRLKSGSIGLSYVDRFNYAGGSVTRQYSSEAFAHATGAQAILLPQANIPANIVPQFPVVATHLSTANKTITVTVGSGNVASTILVFVK